MKTMQFTTDGNRVIGRSVPAQFEFRAEPQQEIEPVQEEFPGAFCDEINPLFVDLVPKRQITTAEVEMKILLLSDQMGIPVKTLLKFIKRDIG